MRSPQSLSGWAQPRTVDSVQYNPSWLSYIFATKTLELLSCVCWKLVTHAPGLSPEKLMSPEGALGLCWGGNGVMPHGRLIPAWQECWCAVAECGPGGCTCFDIRVRWAALAPRGRGVSLGTSFLEGPAQGGVSDFQSFVFCLQRV